jgi:hypothetical protein
MGFSILGTATILKRIESSSPGLRQVPVRKDPWVG